MDGYDISPSAQEAMHYPSAQFYVFSSSLEQGFQNFLAYRARQNLLFGINIYRG